MLTEKEKLAIEKIKKRKLTIEKTLEKKIAYFQNKLEIANNVKYQKIEILTIEDLIKLATSQNKDGVKDFINYLAKIKVEFDLELEEIRHDMYGDYVYSIRYRAKLRLHLFLAMKSMLKFAYANCEQKYYYQRAFWQCGDDDFAFTMLSSLKALA